MSEVYVDIRLKIPSKELIDPHCNHDLENALVIGENICSEIKESVKHIDFIDVDVVNVGKLAPLTFELSEDQLADD